MAENIQVNFKVSGNDLSNYIAQVQKKSDELTNSAIKGAIEQNNKAKENLKLIADQIIAVERKSKIEIEAHRVLLANLKNEAIEKVKAKQKSEYDFIKSKEGKEGYTKEVLTAAKVGADARANDSIETINNQYKDQIHSTREQEREVKLQTKMSRENIETLKDTAAKNIKAITSGDMKLADVIGNAQTDEEKLVAQITKEGVEKEKHPPDEDGGHGWRNKSIFTNILAVENLNKVLSFGSTLANTKNGFDMIGNTFRDTGTALGSVFGDAAGKIMGEIAGAIGDFLQRSAIAKQGYLKEVYSYRGKTGTEFGGSANMLSVGMSATDFVKLQTEFARRRGSAGLADKSAMDAVYADKGFGVDQGTSASLVEMQRSSKESNRDLASLIGGVIDRGKGNIFKGGDTTFLNEFLGKFAQLQKELLKNQSYVPTGTTMDIFNRFNKLGGEWDVRDPRSMGNINAIQSGLSNPNSDNIRALAYRALSKSNPRMGMFDLQEEMSKGLGSPGYLKSMLGFIDQIGGGDQMEMMNLSGMFKGLSPSAVRRLYNNRKGVMSGKISMDELRGQYPGDFKDRAERNTTDMEITSANLETKLLNGMLKSAAAMVDAFKTGLTNSLSGAVITINDGSGKIEFTGKKDIPTNKTKTALNASGGVSH